MQNPELFLMSLMAAVHPKKELVLKLKEALDFYYEGMILNISEEELHQREVRTIFFISIFLDKVSMKSDEVNSSEELMSHIETIEQIAAGVNLFRPNQG